MHATLTPPRVTTVNGELNQMPRSTAACLHASTTLDSTSVMATVTSRPPWRRLRGRGSGGRRWQGVVLPCRGLQARSGDGELLVSPPLQASLRRRTQQTGLSCLGRAALLSRQAPPVEAPPGHRRAHTDYRHEPKNANWSFLATARE